MAHLPDLATRYADNECARNNGHSHTQPNGRPYLLRPLVGTHNTSGGHTRGILFQAPFRQPHAHY